MQKIDTILLIDDDYITNYINQDLICSLGVAYSIPVAYNGREGLDYLKKIILKKNCKSPSLILLDLQMPVMDGFEFLIHYNNLKLQTNHNINLAILTSDERETTVTQYWETFSYIQKPLTEEKLLNLFKNLSKNKVSALPILPQTKKDNVVVKQRKNLITFNKKQAVKEFDYAL